MAKATGVASRIAQEKKEQEERRLWTDLPPELLGLILSNLFAGDCSTFRATCRSWRSIHTIPRPLALPVKDSTLSQCPYLMFFHRKTNSVNFFHPICNASFQMHIPELVNAEIRFSKYDWLLMSQGERATFFFNPFTRERIDLPDTPEHGFKTICFSSPPTSSDCLVIGYDYDICTLKLGKEEAWTIHQCQNNKWLYVSNCSPVLYNGMYYFLLNSGELGIFDPTNDQCCWTVSGNPNQRLSNSQQNFLLESDGDIFSVFVAREGRRVYVLRLDLSKKVWREVKSLGGKMLYVCIRRSFSQTAMVRGTGNKIYFPRFYGNKEVFYSLATQKFHSFDGNYSRADLYGTKEMKHCTWVNPMHTTA